MNTCLVVFFTFIFLSGLHGAPNYSQLDFTELENGRLVCDSENSWKLVSYQSVGVTPLRNPNGLRADGYSCISVHITTSVKHSSFIINVFLNVTSEDSGVDVFLFEDGSKLPHKIYNYNLSENFGSGWYSLRIPVDLSELNVYIIGYGNKDELVLVDSVQHTSLNLAKFNNNLLPILPPSRTLDRETDHLFGSYKSNNLNIFNNIRSNQERYIVTNSIGDYIWKDDFERNSYHSENHNDDKENEIPENENKEIYQYFRNNAVSLTDNREWIVVNNFEEKKVKENNKKIHNYSKNNFVSRLGYKYNVKGEQNGDKGKIDNVSEVERNNRENDNYYRDTNIIYENNDGNGEGDNDGSGVGDEDNDASGEGDGDNDSSGEEGEDNEGSGEGDEENSGGGEEDEDNNGSGEEDEDNNGSGEGDEENSGGGEEDEDNNGSGEEDEDNNGSGEEDEDNNGSGEEDGDNNGSGEEDEDNNGSGEEDEDNNGSGEEEGGDDGSGEGDGDDDGSGEGDGDNDGNGDEDGDDDGFWTLLTITIVSVGSALVLILIISLAYYLGTLKSKPIVVLEDIEPPKTIVIPRVKDVYSTNTPSVINNNFY